jgi:cobalt-zinc-cadmium efflux system outer membrane protein
MTTLTLSDPMLNDRRQNPRGLSGWWLILAACCLTGCAHFQSQPLSASGTSADFESRSLTNQDLRAFLETNRVNLPGQHDSWDLKALTLVAFYYQPTLAEARAQLLAVQAARITAGGRPNPSVSVTPGYDSGIPGNPSPWLVPVTLDWPIETAGKRRKRMAQAELLAEATRWNLVGTIWQVRSRVRAALVNLNGAREIELLLAHQTMTQSNIVHLLEGQIAAGSISSFEATPSRVALDSARLAWQDAVGQSRLARVQLATALGVPLQALDGVAFSLASLGQFPPDLTKPEIRRQALLNRSDVRGALAEYAASQSALQLEIANQYPDLHLGQGYAWNAGSAGDSQWTLGLTLTLPVLNQNQGPIAEANAKRAQAAAHFLVVQANTIGEINSALAGYAAALAQAETAQTLLQSLQQRLDSVRAQAKAGETDALAIASAEVEFTTGAQSQLAAKIKIQQALGQLEDAVQSPLILAPAMLHAAEHEVHPE